MKIIREDNLQKYRQKTRCENCGLPSFQGLDPHHVLTRGMGGGTRNDSDLNLMALCRTCHDRFHNGKIPREQLVGKLALREGFSPDELERIVNRVRHKDKGMHLEVHPVAKEFPRPDTERYKEIRDSIHQHGQLEKVKVWNLQIMDGMTRHQICQELGIDCQYEHWECDEGTAIIRAMILNAMRRDLDKIVRAMAVAECMKRYEKANKERQKAGLKQGEAKPGSPCVSLEPHGENTGETAIMRKTTAEVVAEQADVSPATAKRIIKVTKKASEKVKEAVKRKRVKVRDAAEVADLPKEKQDEALAKVEAGEAKTLVQASKQEPATPEAPEPVVPRDSRGRVVFTEDCLRYQKAITQYQEHIKLVRNALRGVKKIEEDLSRLISNHNTPRAQIAAVCWKVESWDGGFSCPLCLGLGQYDEETVKALVAAGDRVQPVESKGKTCPICDGRRWLFGVDGEKFDEGVIFAQHAPWRKDIRKCQPKAEEAA